MQQLKQIIQAITSENGRCFYVGGYVRDFLLGKETYDYDIEVYHLDFEKLVNILSCYGTVEAFTDFGVARIKEFPNYEFALPRTEQKVGTSHTDFKVTTNSNLDMRTAATRRDFTINTIMMDCISGEIISLHQGIEDLRSGIIRHVSDQFTEDPLRVLRALRFSAKLGFEIDDETLKRCLTMLDDLDYLSNERFVKEFSLLMSYEHLQVANKYLKEIIFRYFKINYYQEFAYYNTSDIELRTILFFYMIKDNDLSDCISRLVNRKQLVSKIDFIINTPLTDYYAYFSCYGRQAIDIYKVILNRDLEAKYEKFLQLKKKYNGNYFLSKGVDKLLISKMIESKIKDEL